MALVIRNIEDIQAVKKLLKKSLTNKAFDAKKFCGVLPVNEDALVIQKRLREEWN